MRKVSEDAWVEDDVEGVVAFCVARSLLSLSEDMVESVTESLFVEVLDWEGDVPSDGMDTKKKLEGAGLLDTLADMQAETDEVDDLCGLLSKELLTLGGDEEEEEELQQGECELCEREAPITRHHVHPLKVHDYCINHLGRTKPECHITIGICRPCHNAVHRLADHKNLATYYNTVEKLLAAPEILKFVKWVSTQKIKQSRPLAQKYKPEL